MKRHINIKNGIIVILTILLFLVILNPGGHLPNRNIEVLRIDSIPFTVHDTLYMDSLVEVEVEVPIEIEVPREVIVTQSVDTSEILKIFYVKNIKKDVLTLPNNVGTLTLIDTISQNKIVGRYFESKIKKQIVKDTLRLPEEKKNKVYFGVNTQVDRPNLINGLGMGLLYQTKEDKIFKVGVGVNNWVKDGVNGTFTPYVDAGIYWKIKVRR
jgi:hypothetical protein